MAATVSFNLLTMVAIRIAGTKYTGANTPSAVVPFLDPIPDKTPLVLPQVGWHQDAPFVRSMSSALTDRVEPAMMAEVVDAINQAIVPPSISKAIKLGSTILAIALPGPCAAVGAAIGTAAHVGGILERQAALKGTLEAANKYVFGPVGLTITIMTTRGLHKFFQLEPPTKQLLLGFGDVKDDDDSDFESDDDDDDDTPSKKAQNESGTKGLADTLDDSDTQANADVKPGSEPKADTDIKGDPDTNAYSPAKAEADAKVDADNKADADIKADSGSKDRAMADSDTQVHSETKAKADSVTKDKPKKKPASSNVALEMDELDARGTPKRYSTPANEPVTNGKPKLNPLDRIGSIARRVLPGDKGKGGEEGEGADAKPKRRMPRGLERLEPYAHLCLPVDVDLDHFPNATQHYLLDVLAAKAQERKTRKNEKRGAKAMEKDKKKKLMKHIGTSLWLIVVEKEQVK